MKEEIKIWLEQAVYDFEYAKYNLEGKRLKVVALLVQQSIEKALKAVFIKKFGQVPKVHEKDSYIDLIIVSDKFKNKKFHERPVELYDYWELDYPVDFLCYTLKEFNKKKKMIGIVNEALKNCVEV